MQHKNRTQSHLIRQKSNLIVVALGCYVRARFLSMSRKIEKGGSYRPAVALRREAKDRLSGWCELHDEEIGKTLSKMALWFVGADPIVQAVVLRRVVPRLKSPAAAALRVMADELERQADADATTAAKAVPLVDENDKQVRRSQG
jgi:hypothetical protein